MSQPGSNRRPPECKRRDRKIGRLVGDLPGRPMLQISVAERQIGPAPKQIAELERSPPVAASVGLVRKNDA